MMVMITIQFPEAVEKKAWAVGLLTSEKMAAFIEAEPERQEAGANLLQIMDQL